MSDKDRSLHPCRTNKAGLSLHTQKQLLQDIEDAGGIGDGKTIPFHFSQLCDKRKDVYGEPASKQRKKIRNKVDAWRAKSQEEYFGILASFGIQTPVIVNSSLRLVPSPQSSPQSQYSPQSSSEKSSISPTPTPPRSNPARERTRQTMFQSPKRIVHRDDDDNGKLKS